MKKKSDPRHLKRIKQIQSIFSLNFGTNTTDKNEGLDKIKKNLKEIDGMIIKAAPQFPIDKIAKIDVTILRLALYELFYIREEPPKVIIDEAVELAKEFGGENSPCFVNGVLGTIYKNNAG